MVGTMKKPKSEGKITFSSLFQCYIVIYFDPDVEKNVIQKKNTEQEAKEFLDQQNERNKVQKFWWDEK